MGYLLNYSNWNKLYESKLLEAVNWNESSPMLPVTAGNELQRVNVGDGYTEIDIDQTTDNEIWTTMTNLLGKEAIPNLYVSLGGNSSITPSNQVPAIKNVFNAILQGIAQYAGDKTIFDSNDKIKAVLPTLQLSKIQEGSVELIGPSWGKINTVGNITGELIKNVDKTAISGINQMCAYINGFNLQNWAAGNFTQYDPTKIVNGDKIVDLTKNGRATIVEKGYLTLVSLATAAVTAGSRDTTTELTQGEEGKDGAVEISFTVGSSVKDAEGVTVDANHPKVKEIGDKITEYLGETGVIDKMTLVSSASPEYGAIKNAAGWEKSYIKGTTGTADPGVGTTDATKNMKLAYDRGVTFRNALIAYLGAHLKANSISVSWKISTDAPGNGRNISYSIATQSVAPQPIERTTYQGAKVTVTKGDNKIYIYKIKFKANAVIGEGKRKAKAYEDLTKGDVIKIKGIVNGVVSDKLNDRKEVTVSKFEDNKMYVKVPAKDENGDVIKDQFTDKYIEKERYIGLADKQQKAESEI